MKLFIQKLAVLLVASATSLASFADESVSYTYNAAGQILTKDGPRTDVSDITTYTYDAKGNRATMTNARGHVVHYNAYDTLGHLLSMTDANGVIAEFTYHDRGWLLSSRMKHPSNNTLDSLTTYSYDPVGLMIGMTLPNGYQLTYEYDAARRLTAIQNAAGERIEYTVDVAGNRTQQKIKNNAGTIVYSVAQAFDELSRVMAITGNNGQNEKHQYDVNDNATAVTDGRNNKTQQTYDALNRVAKVIDPNLKETQFTYDAQNRIKTVTDARGNTTAYNYDGLGNLLSQVSPDTGTTIFTYDSAGNRTSSKDARDVVVTYSYDDLNRLISVSYPASPIENITYSYDSTTNGSFGIGRLASISTAVARNDYMYNHLGLITKKFIQVGSSLSTAQYTYDTTGNLISMIYPTGRLVNYVRDSAGRVQKITTQASASASVQVLISGISYMPFGPAASYTYGNGLSHTNSFDTDYRLTAIQIGGVLSRKYSYDFADNIAGIADQLSSAKTQIFSYDNLNRLTDAKGTYGTLAYSYDDVGNRLTEKDSWGNQSTYSYESSSNRLLNIQPPPGTFVRNYSYDAAGNLLQGPSNTWGQFNYGYNKAGRLVTTVWGSAAVNQLAYNALGQRVSRTYKPQSGGAMVTELYHYDEAGHLISVTNTTGTLIREYIYNGNQLVGFVTGGILYFVHSDHLTTPQVVTNQSQAVVWVADYEPFGKAKLGLLNSISLDSRFPGQYVDSETGNYYNYFRDYDPSIGRYIESDPIGLNGGINTYAYVGGDPIQYSDALGLSRRLLPTTTNVHAVQVGFMIRQIRTIEPSFNYYTIRPSSGPGSGYTQADVNALSRVLRDYQQNSQTYHNGVPVGRFVCDARGNTMVEPVGGSTVPWGRNGQDTHTRFPNDSNYMRLNPQGHPNNPTPHGHGHQQGTGTGRGGQGPSLDIFGNVVPPNSGPAHWPIN